MADNTGLYITYGDLLLEMVIAENSKVTVSDITLTNLVADPGGDTFDFSVGGSDPQPKIGDVIHQGGQTSCIVSFPSAGKLKLDSTGKIVESLSDLFHAEKIPKVYGEAVIQQAMALIDNKTGQFFNKREGDFRIEGKNVAIMHLSVPIIEIEKLIINSTNTELVEGEDFDFVAFKARSQPTDDRRNPRIKLNVGRGRDSIFANSLTTRIFVKGTLTQLIGSFGFLEPDGSTPFLIQRATKILAMADINTPIGGSLSVSSSSGPLKRLKVDLHEQEFFEPSSNKDSVKSSDSGSEEVDRIIAQYRTPIRIGGSFRHRRSDEFPGRSNKFLA